MWKFRTLSNRRLGLFWLCRAESFRAEIDASHNNHYFDECLAFVKRDSDMKRYWSLKWQFFTKKKSESQDVIQA